MPSLEDAERVVRSATSARHLCLLVGSCRVSYSGRAASKLSEGDRLLVIKGDGTFLVHQGKGMTAINYQGPGSTVATRVEDRALVIESHGKRKPGQPQERIEARFTRVDFAQSFPLRDDSKLLVSGTEEELAGLLMAEPDRIEPGLTPLKQESARAHGEIDILARDLAGRLVVVEVKRRTAELAAVTQLRRYVEELAKRKGEAVRGILAAPGISENAKRMLEEWGYEFARVDFDASVADAPKIKRLERRQKSLSEYSPAPAGKR
jgi:hypothetical protein